MLQYFTWQQFLLAAMVFSLIWYLGVILIFYRKELNTFLGKKKKETNSINPLPHRWENDVDELKTEDDLIGKPQEPEGLKSVSMDEFTFTEKESTKESQLGLIPDVLEELKRIFSILEKEDGNKADFFSLVELVKSKYPALSSHPDTTFINEFIAENASFHINREELDNLWN